MKDWKKVKLGTLLTESKVVSEKPSTDKRLRVKLNVLGVEKRPVTKDKKGATKYYTRKAGQFVYGKQNLHKGAFGIVPDELDGFESSLDIPAFDIDKSCYPEWIFYFFKKGDFYLKLETLAKGVGSKRIHPKQIFELDIFLPSKEEQKKVLDEIEKAEASNQELVLEIESQEENLTKLRQSILQDAVEGKLTKEWRVQNPEVEPASELLKKIKAEKEQLIKEKKIKKDKPLLPITKDEIPFEIPECWEWCRMGSTGNVMTSPFVDGPFGSSINTKRDYIESGVPVLRMMNVKPYRFKDDSMKYISQEKYQSFLRHNVIAGDILFSKVGAGIGEACIVPETFTYGMLSTTGISRFRVGEIIINEYLCHFINGHITLFKSLAKSSAQPFLNMTQIKSVLIPLPPVEEQNTIVQKVNQLLSNCNVLEQEIKTSKTNAEKLMQSVLRELLGEENNVLINKTTSKKKIKKPSREIKYNSKTVLMDLVKLLKENGKLHAEDLWKMSKFPDDIDAFYAELKKQIEEEKAIKEVANEKGYLELV